MEVQGNEAHSVTVKDGIAATVKLEYDEHGQIKNIDCSVLFVDDLKKTSPQSASGESGT